MRSKTDMQRRRSDKPKVDRLDMRILTSLAERGRQPITELSKKVGLSPTPCSARVERLEELGLILGYQADVDVEQLDDLSLYYVTIAIKTYSAELVRKIEALITGNPYIVSADCLFGALDYIMVVYARSTHHYHEIMAPFLEFDIDYKTWPVSRRLMRSHVHRLVAQLNQERA
jgi:DNA-binding Lrp family transcriptional regulator